MSALRAARAEALRMCLETWASECTIDRLRSLVEDFTDDQIEQAIDDLVEAKLAELEPRPGCVVVWPAEAAA